VEAIFISCQAVWKVASILSYY